MEQLPTGYFSNTLKVSSENTKVLGRNVQEESLLCKLLKIATFHYFCAKRQKTNMCKEKSQWFSHARKAKVNFYGDDKSFEEMFQTFVCCKVFQTLHVFFFPSFAGMFAAANLSNFRTNVQQQQQQNWVQQLTAGDEELVKMVSKAENYRLASCHIIKSWLWSEIISFVMWHGTHDLIRVPWLFLWLLASGFFPNLEKKRVGQHLSYSTILPHSFLWHIEEALPCLPCHQALSIKRGRRPIFISAFLFSRYCRFLARYSGLVLVSISTLSVIAIICSLTLHQLPDFTDPQAVSNRYKKHFSFQSWKSVESLQTSTKFNLPLFFWKLLQS